MDAQCHDHRSLQLEGVLAGLLSKTIEAKLAAEHKRKANDVADAERCIEAIKKLQPFCGDIRVSVAEAESIGKMIKDASTCTYSYMYHNQVVGLTNLIVGLGQR